MSDEYSLHTRFLAGDLTAEGYERERERLRAAEEALTWEAVRALSQDDDILPAAILLGVVEREA